MRQCKFAIAWLTAVSLALSPLSAAGFGQTTNDSGLLANNCSEESPPLPERPVLGRSTFASHAPHVPGKAKHKPRPFAKRKTEASKPTHVKKPTASKPTTAKPGAHKPFKKHAKKPSKPLKKRKTIHKRNGGLGHDGGIKHGGKNPLQRATFGSPICQDRAPVMQAFGVGDMDQPLGDEFARAVQDALSPQDNQFTDSPGNFPRNFGSGFPNIPGLNDSGTPNTGGGGGNNGTNPGGGGNNGGGNNGGGNNGGGNNGGGGTTPAVPEPSSWALMILGFGLIGASLRRRRQVDQRA